MQKSVKRKMLITYNPTIWKQTAVNDTSFPLLLLVSI